MKKRTKVIGIIGCILLLYALLLVWWFMPTHFLRGVESQQVAAIEVFNGNNGNKFEITDSEDITYIIDHIQQQPFHKTQLSLFYIGTLYQMRFMGADGNEIDHFFVNSYRLIRRDPFFYECDESMGVIEYMENLEKTQFPKES